MKRILMAVVFMGMTGGAYATDFSDLQTFKVSNIKDAAMVPVIGVPLEVKTDTILSSDILDKSKRAHKTTWSTLMLLKFIPQEVFSKAGGLTVDDGQGTLVGHMLAAQQIDNIFVEIRGAKRVEGINQVRVIAQTLSGKNTSVKDFANLMDTMYVFWGE